MKLIIDVVLLVIIALCVWGGFKRGIIGGIAGILVIVLALFGGTLLSSAYAHEVVPALEPFMDGIIDSEQNTNAILDKLGYGDSDYSLDDILASDTSLRYDYAYECMRYVGFYQERAEELSRKCVEYAGSQGTDMTKAVVSVLCDTITYVGGLIIAFLMILIGLVAIGNLFNLSLRLPNMEAVDEAGGAFLGFVKGVVYCVLLCWVLSFLGVVIGRDTLGNTTLARFFLLLRFITNGLM